LTLEPPLRLKEIGARATADVGGVVRCAYGWGEYSESRYTVVVIQGTENSVHSARGTFLQCWALLLVRIVL
jgi:hypothetical protein